MRSWSRTAALVSSMLPACVAGCRGGPEPSWLLFQSDRTGDGDVFVWTRGTPPVTLIGRPGADWGARWDPANRVVVFLSDEADGTNLWSVPADGGDPTPLGPNPGFESPPDWSPDGRAMVFAARDGGRIGLWIRSAEGGPDRVLLPGPGNDRAPVWSPDGRQVAFVSNRSGEDDIWVVDADGENPRNVTISAGFLEDHPAWAPDGERLVYDRTPAGTTEADIWVHAIAGDSSAAVVTAPGTDLVPAWSEDGWIAFGSSRDGDWDIYRIRPDGTGEEQVTDAPGFDGDPKWLPPGAIRLEK